MNGEIYNFRSISSEYLGQHYESDTRVLVEGIAKIGLGFFKLLTGMFAGILIDNQTKKIYIFRDFFGEKPLFYSFSKEGIHISSEFRDLLSAKNCDLKLNNKAILNYFRFGYVEEPETFDETIKAFPKGAVLAYDQGDRTFKTELELGGASLGNNSLNYIIQEVAAEVLRSDVPQGFLLSGGLDSTTLLSLANRKNLGWDMAFTLKGVGASNLKDLNGAKKFARRIGIRHETVEISKREVISELPNLVEALDQPISDMSSFGYFRLFRSIHEKGLKVAQIGHGIDEMFWGYGWFNKLIYESDLKKERIFWNTPSDQSILLDKGFLEAENQGHYELHPSDPYLRSESKFQRARAEICHSYLSHNGLSQIDRLAMFHSVEPRAAFSDFRLYQWAQQHSTNEKDFEKRQFRNSFDHSWVKRLVTRKKRGFDIGMIEYVNSPEFGSAYLSKISELRSYNLPLAPNLNEMTLGARQKYRLIVLSLWLQSI
jgi:asparagine synthase (glutamine-hydrolysing)